MTSISRIARAAACASLLAIPSVSVGIDVTVRVEGTTSTIVPETRVSLPDSGLTTITNTSGTGTGSTRVIDARLAAAALASALASRNTAFGWSWDNTWGLSIDQLGSERPDWNTCFCWWNFRVNGGSSNVGAGQVIAAPGDAYLWAASDGAQDELDVRGPAAPAVSGSRFQVRVVAFAATEGWADGGPTPQASPRAGATVSYGSQTSTTGTDGIAEFIAEGSGIASVQASASGAIRDSTAVCSYAPADPTACDLPALPTAVAPTPTREPDNIARIPISLSAGGRDVAITAEVPLPIKGSAPVAIRRSMIGGADLSPAEMRKAMAIVASALAADLNARAARGDDTVALPAGVTWQAAWLSGAPYVAPLRRGESLMGIRAGGPRNTTAMRQRTQGFNAHLQRCDMNARATTVRRHGYAITTLRPAIARTALVECVRERP